MRKRKQVKAFEKFKDKTLGKKGTPKRDKYEKALADVVKKHNAKHKRKGEGVTQKELDKMRKNIPVIPKKKTVLKEKHAHKFEDAQKSAEIRGHYIPSAEEIKTIKKGDSLKVGFSGDYFWITVTEISGNKIKGTVEHKLAKSPIHKIEENQEVQIETKNIFKIYKN